MSATTPSTTTTTSEDELNNNNTTQEISYLNIPIHEIIQKTRITHGLGNNSGSIGGGGGGGGSSGSGSGLAGCFLGIGDDDNDNNNHHNNNDNDDDSCSTSSSSSQNGNNNNNDNEKRKENNENDLYGYTLYRKYCTRRLARLRRASSVRSELSHGRLGGGGSSGGKDNKGATSGGGYKRNEYRPLPPLTTALSTSTTPTTTSTTTSTTTTPLHENHVLVLVFQSERAWSRAMEARCILENMKIGGGSSSNQKKKMIQTDKLVTMSELKQNYQGRLRRVYKEVLSMEEFMNVITATNTNTATTNNNKYGGGLDKITQLEIRAYASWMKGQWFLELGRWKVSFFLVF